MVARPPGSTGLAESGSAASMVTLGQLRMETGDKQERERKGCGQVGEGGLDLVTGQPGFHGSLILKDCGI